MDPPPPLSFSHAYAYSSPSHMPPRRCGTAARRFYRHQPVLLPKPAPPRLSYTTPFASTCHVTPLSPRTPPAALLLPPHFQAALQNTSRLSPILHQLWEEERSSAGDLVVLPPPTCMLALPYLLPVLKRRPSCWNLQPPVLQRSVACCKCTRPQLQKRVTGATKAGPWCCKVHDVTLY
jgi:hypothetical protein